MINKQEDIYNKNMYGFNGTLPPHNSKLRNYAFIDGQNLYIGTTMHNDIPWEVDLARFRIYLENKHNVSKAYYFLGYSIEDNEGVYNEIREAGYILKFREHNSTMIGKKKGNVDSDIIFYIMKMIYKNDSFAKIVLVAGDGDYKVLVDFLIEENRFEKILFPNRAFRSSLYKGILNTFLTYLDDADIKDKIGKKKDPKDLNHLESSS